MINLKARLISGTGRRNNLMIPSNSLRVIETDFPVWPEERNLNVYVVLSDDEMLKKSFFVPTHNFMVVDGYVAVPLYNGSHEATYIQHGQTVATLLIYPGVIEE